MEATAIEIRLSNAETRLEANHDSIRELRGTSAAHDTKIQVITTELRETREDIAEMRKEGAEQRKEQKEEMSSLKRAFWAAAGTGALVFVALATLLVNLAAGAH